MKSMILERTMRISTMTISTLNPPPRIFPNGNETFVMFFSIEKGLLKYNGIRTMRAISSLGEKTRYNHLIMDGDSTQKTVNVPNKPRNNINIILYNRMRIGV